MKVLDETKPHELEKVASGYDRQQPSQGGGKDMFAKDWLWVGSTPLAHCVGNYYGDIRKYRHIHHSVSAYPTSITDKLYPIK